MYIDYYIYECIHFIFQAVQTCVGAAGFSVGEFAALVFAGVMSFADGMLYLYWFLLFNTDSMFIHTLCKCTDLVFFFFSFFFCFLVDYNSPFIYTNYSATLHRK